MRKDNRYWTSTPSFRDMPANRTIRQINNSKLIKRVELIKCLEKEHKGKYWVTEYHGDGYCSLRMPMTLNRVRHMYRRIPVSRIFTLSGGDFHADVKFGYPY